MNKFQEYYSKLASLLPTHYKKLNNQILKDLKPCKMESCYDLFSKEEIAKMKSRVRPKECYKNAFLLLQDSVLNSNDWFYVEGRVLVGSLPLEHAWLAGYIPDKSGDVQFRHFDPTLELALGNKPSDYEYAYLRTYTYLKVRDVVLSKETYGNIYEWYFAHEEEKLLVS